MSGRTVNLIVIHCSATPNGVSLARGKQNPAQVIDAWHRKRGFKRNPTARLSWNQPLSSIGYHFVIDVNGLQYTGRHLDEIGAHAAGKNRNSVGICLVGTSHFTQLQWQQLATTVAMLREKYPLSEIVGHRDLSPDVNRDGKITPNEFCKICPGFGVGEWLTRARQPLIAHLCEVRS